jgi:hypothetical protein
MISGLSCARADQVGVAAPQRLQCIDVEPLQLHDVPLEPGRHGEHARPVDLALADRHHHVVGVTQRRAVLHVQQPDPVPQPAQHLDRVGTAHDRPVRVQLHDHPVVKLLQQQVIGLPTVEELGELGVVVVVGDPHPTGGCPLGRLVDPGHPGCYRGRAVELLPFHAPDQDLRAELGILVEDLVRQPAGREWRVRAGQHQSRGVDRAAHPRRPELLDQAVGLDAPVADLGQQGERARQVAPSQV